MQCTIVKRPYERNECGMADGLEYKIKALTAVSEMYARQIAEWRSNIVRAYSNMIASLDRLQHALYVGDQSQVDHWNELHFDMADLKNIKEIDAQIRELNYWSYPAEYQMTQEDRLQHLEKYVQHQKEVIAKCERTYGMIVERMERLRKFDRTLNLSQSQDRVQDRNADRSQDLSQDRPHEPEPSPEMENAMNIFDRLERMQPDSDVERIHQQHQQREISPNAAMFK